jgi:glycosyltransferase involved in cell wall biosynthesis
VQEADLREARGADVATRAEEPGSIPANAGRQGQHAPGLSIVVPTRNEAGNVAPLVERIERVSAHFPVPHQRVEVIFVDDSDDNTPDAVRAVESDIDVRLIHRPAADRVGGLSGAVVEGIRSARADWVCVMDGDLQHPPEVLEQLLLEAVEQASDLVVASRFCEGGDIGNFSKLRTSLSKLCSSSAALLFRNRLRKVSDPLSGYFLLRREAVDLNALQPKGFKILLEILVRTPGLRVSEVPFEFGERYTGETKASVREGMRYFAQLMGLRFGELTARFGRFGVVGITGLAVNMFLIALFADVAGLYYVAAAILATQGSTLWNFCLTELWVFPDRQHRRSGASRMAMFFLVNNVALVLRVPMLFALTTGLGVHYLWSNLISLVSLTVARYALADLWIWGKAHGSKAQNTYDIHGIVTVASEVRLPELERFRVSELPGPAEIDVRIGKVKRANGLLVNGVFHANGTNGHGAVHVNGNGAVHANGNGTVHVNGNGNGAVHANGNGNGEVHVNGNGAAHVNGNGNGAVHTNGNGNGTVHANGNGNGNGVLHTESAGIRYAEGRGPFGFRVEITDVGDRIEVVASQLLKFSPHVLYTNVVEPILRWTLVSKNYALVHAACFADGEDAFMITARTDTGKTTTCLKTLDKYPYSFVSDDLTILCPDGRVLTYPKPLTISRHTVAAVKQAQLTRRQRIGLIIQSRLHSRSGRRFAMVIAKLRLPAATINAVVQFLVPPPKYHVEKLVPTAKIAPEAKLAALVVIQRGGLGDVELEGDEALKILLQNCEDAYGFPPYDQIAGFLHSRNGNGLQDVERGIIAGVLSEIPSTLLRSETMDWCDRLPAVMENVQRRNGNGVTGSK